MSWIVETALGNALAILPLAGIVWLVTRRIPFPALSRSLWILLLVKLLSLPLLPLPVAPAVVGTAENWLSADEDASLGGSSMRTGMTSLQPQSALPASWSWSALTTAVFSVKQAAAEQWQALRRIVGLAFHASQRLVLLLWGLGALGLAVYFWLQTRSFSHFATKHSRRNEDLDHEVRALGNRLKLRSLPKARLINARISPLLFGVGRSAKLYFPAALWAELDQNGRRSLLLHELIHYKRGDHWIRLLEFICISLYWWHPLVWWVKRRIEETEEESCDEAVIKLEDSRVYASAIISALDHLACAPERRPALACGLSAYPWMHHRLQRILSRERRSELCKPLRRGILLAGLCLLPLQPCLWAPDEPAAPFQFLDAFEDEQYLLARGKI